MQQLEYAYLNDDENDIFGHDSHFIYRQDSVGAVGDILEQLDQSGSGENEGCDVEDEDGHPDDEETQAVE